MAETKISSRKSGAPRFVGSNDGWKPTLTEYKLTEEQLERYKNGESIDEILKGEKEVKVSTKLTKERYLELKRRGLPDANIVKEYGFKYVNELTAWKKKHLSPEEIEQLRKSTIQLSRGENKADLSVQNVPESKTTETEKSPENEEMSKEIDRLKREVIHAHKLVTEKDERLKESLNEHLRKDELIEKLQKQLEQSVELYETAMLDKEKLHKENTTLINEVKYIKRELKAIQDQRDRYQSEYIELEEEVNGLRRFALTKLKRDVYPA
ncbi:hypothetical protein ACQKCU_23970 [Heyndrickxia sporothermodurans]